MRIFFDTNVLISAFISQGLCFDLVNRILAKQSRHYFLTGKVVLIELEDKLKNRFQFSPEDLQKVLDLINEQEVANLPSNPPPIPVRDSDDALVLASALEAKSDILLTGDQDLLILNNNTEIKIIDPRTLWEILENEKSIW